MTLIISQGPILSRWSGERGPKGSRLQAGSAIDEVLFKIRAKVGTGQTQQMI